MFSACNGIIEAFVFVAMSPEQLKNHKYVLYGLSIIYLALTIMLGSSMGAVGIICAQIGNMTIRILHGTRFIGKLYNQPASEILISSSPAIQTWCALILSMLIQSGVYILRLFSTVKLKKFLIFFCFGHK